MQFVVFVQTLEKLTHALLNLFEKYAKIMYFYNVVKKSFEISGRFLKIAQQVAFFVLTRDRGMHGLCMF